MTVFEKNNPAGILSGEPCFAICLDAFRPGTDNKNTGVYPGTLMADYFSKPACVPEADMPPMYFLPDQLLEGTEAISDAYCLDRWMAFRTRTEAMAGRATMARKAIDDMTASITELKKLL